MIRLPLHPLPSSTGGKLVCGCVILGVLLILAGRRIVQLQALLDARPLVEDFRTDARREDVRRGPVTLKRRTETKPDGTRIVDSERTTGPVESHSEAESASAHRETPQAPPRRPLRWAYLDFDPIHGGYAPVGGRLGMDVLERFAVGGWYYHPASAFGVTIGARF